MTGFVVQGSKLLQAHKKENWLTGEIQKLIFTRSALLYDLMN